jgi:hypothetical protein
MSRNDLFRAVPARAFALAAALAVLVLAAAPAAAQCPVTPGVDWVNVELLDPPVPGPGLSTTEAEIMRREHVHLSSSLADMLALDDLVDSDPFAPNPQVRVVIESPDVFDASNDARLSFGIFTVTGIFESQDVRLRVYERDGGSDKDSGEFKLFADENGSVRTFSEHSGGFLAGALVGVSARVIGIPVSSSQVDGGSSNDPLYCEAASSTYFEEEAVIAAGADVVLTAPHGRNVEVKTSDQLGVVESELAADGVVANVCTSRRRRSTRTASPACVSSWRRPTGPPASRSASPSPCTATRAVRRASSSAARPTARPSAWRRRASRTSSPRRASTPARSASASSTTPTAT